MKITKQRLKEIIKEEVKQSGLLEKRGFFKKLFGKASGRATGVLNMIRDHIGTFPQIPRLEYYEEWNDEYLKLRAKLGPSDPNKEQNALGHEYNKIYMKSMDIIRDINAKNWDRRKAKEAADAVRSKERELEKRLAGYAKDKPAGQAANAARKREDEEARKRQERSDNQEKSWDDKSRRYGRY